MRAGAVHLLLLTLAVLTSCQDSLHDITKVEESARDTFNVENDVYGLVVRYHEARRRAAEYEPLVQQEEERLASLGQQIRTVRADGDLLQRELENLAQAKATLEAQAAEMEAAIAGLHERATALKAATPELEERLKQLVAEIEALSGK